VRREVILIYVTTGAAIRTIHTVIDFILLVLSCARCVTPVSSLGGEKDFYDFCCYGHYEYDQMLDFVSGNRSQVFGLTNREILDATDASSDTYKVQM
jgi:hypothetical protein